MWCIFLSYTYFLKHSCHTLTNHTEFIQVNTTLHKLNFTLSVPIYCVWSLIIGLKQLTFHQIQWRSSLLCTNHNKVRAIVRKCKIIPLIPMFRPQGHNVTRECPLFAFPFSLPVGDILTHLSYLFVFTTHSIHIHLSCTFSTYISSHLVSCQPQTATSS